MKIQIPQTGVIYYINSDKILYCKAERSYCQIFLTNNEPLLCSVSLAEISKKLKPVNFFRIHNSFLINLNFVDKLVISDNYHYVVLTSRIKLPIARNRRKHFQQAMNFFIDSLNTK